MINYTESAVLGHTKCQCKEEQCFDMMTQDKKGPTYHDKIK